jgi:hypothetical protein
VSAKLRKYKRNSIKLSVRQFYVLSAKLHYINRLLAFAAASSNSAYKGDGYQVPTAVDIGVKLQYAGKYVKSDFRPHDQLSSYESPK